MLALPAHRRLIARILLIIFSLMLVNGIVFRHAHKLPNGRVIAHAHPYWPIGKSPYQPNTHTTHEILWLDTITNLVYESPVAFALVFLVHLVGTTVGYAAYSADCPRLVVRFLSLRGPPLNG